ncbi:carboxysome peptide A [Thiocapsa rosea]|uniref:Carboxysome peptide A n=1 Tax=Thiocapsa rosea TaxID=69360 RepID=A0A495V899_9GAMM|nr:carboxysome peptide A [Thiocapsa rosea]RKT44940.1 carboxysome peptide A [Thiocapsa rosea]
MKICQVERPLVSTNRIPGFEHKHLLVVRDGSTQQVAVDAVGCVPGDWVICVGSSAAREAAGSKEYPSDLTIVGIIDHWPPETEAAGPRGAG